MKTHLAPSTAKPCRLCKTLTNAYVVVRRRRVRICGDCRLHRPWKQSLREGRDER